jgi:hypothetical protein
MADQRSDVTVKSDKLMYEMNAQRQQIWDSLDVFDICLASLG